jgi:hypothetical protein
MAEFMQQETMMMSEGYCESRERERERELHRTIQIKRRVHGNTSPHISAGTRALLERCNWELVDHSPYDPYLTPRDCRLFLYMKNWLGAP